MDFTALSPDPFLQFSLWYEDALKNDQLRFPNSMVLATADAQGQPSARVILLKDFNQAGFTFFTNYESQKGEDLWYNPKAALCFYWDALRRQLRIQGTVTKVSAQESSDYFHSRPRESQIGAWASLQSREIDSRMDMEQKFADVDKKYPGEIPRPDYWGGYRLKPVSFEFWQERPHRLHDRAFYELNHGQWTQKRLSP